MAVSDNNDPSSYTTVNLKKVGNKSGGCCGNSGARAAGQPLIMITWLKTITIPLALLWTVGLPPQ